MRNLKLSYTCEGAVYLVPVEKYDDAGSFTLRVSYTALICLNLMLLGLMVTSSVPKSVWIVMVVLL
jgi:hypothetical protein